MVRSRRLPEGVCGVGIKFRGWNSEHGLAEKEEIMEKWERD